VSKSFTNRFKLEANIYRVSAERGMPPVRTLPRLIPREIPGFPEFIAGKNISEPFAAASKRRRTARTTPVPSLDKRQNSNRTFPDTLDDYMSPELDNEWLYPP
jgi:hypothetical protein